MHKHFVLVIIYQIVLNLYVGINDTADDKASLQR